MEKRSGYLLPAIVFSQFAGTSLWFAGNAIIGDIQAESPVNAADITSIVQFGFIAGTLVFSLLTIADRFAAPRVFFVSSVLAAACNLALIALAENPLWLYALRFATGFFLAGIYPVGMKIAADRFPRQVGNALGFLVGALVLGTAFPHVLKSQLQYFRWQDVLLFTSLLALSGGLLVAVLIRSNGRKAVTAVQPGAACSIFRSPDFRAAAFGYFGHMWELYAFWAFVPFLLDTYNRLNEKDLNVPFWSFAVIAAGSLGCIAGGLISKKWGSKKVAFCSLLLSGVCCLLSPALFRMPEVLYITLMLVWGITVVADSPQFSALVARSAPRENKGTALTIVTCLGFAITIISIQVLKPLLDKWHPYSLLVLFIGPLSGLISLKNYRHGKD